MATGALTAGGEAMPQSRPGASQLGELGFAGAAERLTSPLLAVCALCGGAGASTLAYLIARSATARTHEPVLLCDAGGPTGGLAFYAGVQAPRSLAAAANVLSGPDPPSDGLFASAGDGLRVLAGGPDLEEEVDPEGLARLMRDARDAHSLTVVDCGTLRGQTERHALGAASHLAWVMPATVGGVRRAQRVLELIGRNEAREEVLIARRDACGQSAPTEELADLAASRAAPLVLMPHVKDLAEGDQDIALEAVELTIEAIWTVIRR